MLYSILTALLTLSLIIYSRPIMSPCVPVLIARIVNVHKSNVMSCAIPKSVCLKIISTSRLWWYKYFFLTLSLLPSINFIEDMPPTCK